MQTISIPSIGSRDLDARLPKEWCSTDLWTTFGLKFIDEAIAEKKPFYLHLCHNAPHSPLQAPAEEIAKFRGQYMQGWDLLAEKRIQRQREMERATKVTNQTRKKAKPKPARLVESNASGTTYIV